MPDCAAQDFKSMQDRDVLEGPLHYRPRVVTRAAREWSTHGVYYSRAIVQRAFQHTSILHALEVLCSAVRHIVVGE
eukprot:611727-Prorocentrum_minimum.AAC.1